MASPVSLEPNQLLSCYLTLFYIMGPIGCIQHIVFAIFRSAWCATLLSCSIMHSISSVTNILNTFKISCNTVFSKSQNARKVGTLCILYSIQSMTSLIWFTSIKVFFIRFCEFLIAFVFPLKTFRSQSIIILSWYYIPHQMWCDLLSILKSDNLQYNKLVRWADGTNDS